MSDAELGRVYLRVSGLWVAGLGIFGVRDKINTYET
jgi:hypothetical protein